MEFILIPHNLQMREENNMVCSCCNNILIHEVRQIKYTIDECRECRGNSSFSQSCRCTHEQRDCTYIICDTCRSPKCCKCSLLYTRHSDIIQCGSFRCTNNNCSSIICPLCVVWEGKSYQEKMNLYTVKDLKVLAKSKRIKGCSIHKKNELIYLLSSLVDANDLPRK